MILGKILDLKFVLVSIKNFQQNVTDSLLLFLATPSCPQRMKTFQTTAKFAFKGFPQTVQMMVCITRVNKHSLAFSYKIIVCESTQLKYTIKKNAINK